MKFDELDATMRVYETAHDLCVPRLPNRADTQVRSYAGETSWLSGGRGDPLWQS